MDKKELRNHTKRMIVLGMMLGIIIGITLGGTLILFAKDDVKTMELEEDKQFLIEQNDRCWKELRKYDPNCWDTQDCSENPNLQGCSKIECNVCCYNTCTLMNCPNFNKGGFSQ